MNGCARKPNYNKSNEVYRTNREKRGNKLIRSYDICLIKMFLGGKKPEGVLSWR